MNSPSWRLPAAGIVAMLLAVVGGLASCSKSPEAERPPVARSDDAAPPAPAARGERSGDPASDDKPSPFHFTEMPASQTGVTFRHFSGDSPRKPFPAANGSGIAAIDFDLDGLLDLYFLTGTEFPLDASREAPVNPCYRNRGDWRFDDVTRQTGLGDNGYSAGVAVGDFDGDGFPDLYVNAYGPNRLYRNNGDGTFEELAAAAGVDDERWGTSACFFDYNQDGHLDLYVGNYAEWSLETNQFCGDPERKVRIFCSPSSVPPEPDVLYANAGDGTFRDASVEAGINQRLGRAQGVVAADFNGDGLTDLYVGNDLHPNTLLLNAGKGSFRDASETSGAAYDELGQNQAGMGVDAADVDGDGRPELFVTNFEREHNTLYQSMGPELYADVSHMEGVGSDSLRWVGWGTVFADFDIDGRLDLIVTNGHTDDNLHELGRDSPHAQPALTWWNAGDGFRPVHAAAGAYFRSRHVGRALVLADLDEDGDWDVVVGHQDAAPSLLRNDRLPASPQGDAKENTSWAKLRLIGTLSNRDAVGAVVTVRAGESSAVRQVTGGRSYLSAHDLRQLVTWPAGEAAGVEIRWPSGAVTSLDNLEAGRRYDVVESAGPVSSELP